MPIEQNSSRTNQGQEMPLTCQIPNMDMIFIDDMRMPMIIGIYPHERSNTQMVSISLLIGLSTRMAATSDDIADTINYAELDDRLRNDLGSRQFYLVEKLAEHVAALLINDFRAPWVRVTIEKIGVLADVRRVGVIIERSGSEHTRAKSVPLACNTH